MIHDLLPDETTLFDPTENVIYETLTAQVAKGVELEEFLRSDAGKHLIVKAKNQIQAAFVTFLESSDQAKREGARQRALFALQAFRWMLDTINQGDAAAQQIDMTRQRHE